MSTRRHFGIQLETLFQTPVFESQITAAAKGRSVIHCVIAGPLLQL